MIHLLKKILPDSYHPLNYLSKRTIEKANGMIQSGPFKGMQYIEEAYSSGICPKLVGTYEKEIQPWIHEVLEIPFDAIIDIGSAEGYYSVGFALFGKSIKVVSYELSSEARILQLQLAKKNEVEHKIELKHRCENDDLNGDLKKYIRNFILCDVEGYEHALLDMQKLPLLKFSTMVIECHNHVWEEMESSLAKRFGSTHLIQSIRAELNGNPDDYPYTNLIYSILPRKYKNFPILDQRAPETTWLYLKPFDHNQN